MDQSDSHWTNKDEEGNSTNIGRPRLNPDQKQKSYAVRLDADTYAVFLKLGEGKFANGVRKAARLLKDSG